jgi:hypothetical protein
VNLTGSLTRLQGQAESRMLNTCVITAPGTASPELDPDTWLPVVTPGGTLYNGPCRLRVPGGAATGQNRDVAQDRVYITQPVLSIPVSAQRVPSESIVVITGPADHMLVGRRYRVTGLVDGTEMTAQRMLVEGVS